ncbi:hypothetical protein TRFO_33901 [Tritrichomonas foetus]|uniref:Uncharacterized protein n=1 Tax=Tritrichomonas foetus TaxID=1144522 RepID=A0A1J4JKE4_9EUKA|nr:hypothetical protein TRFO_33901 [Tritrichomonas foetus]|eukprot:OHS99608.1 hypothetical protein TRFO_33901 [Tritrichomonas foetus]
MLNSGQDGQSKKPQPVVRRIIPKKTSVPQKIQSPSANPNMPNQNPNISSATPNAPQITQNTSSFQKTPDQPQIPPNSTFQSSSMAERITPLNAPGNVSNLPATSYASTSVHHSQQSLKEDDIFAFSLLAKILLPKDRIEKMNILFTKLLLSKISFVTVSRHISQHLEICPILLNIWQNIINRNVTVNDPLLSKINDIIVWFRHRNASNAIIVNFVASVSNAKKYSMPYLVLFENIVTKFDVLGDNFHLSQIMQMALDLLKLLPQSKHPLRSSIQPVRSTTSFSEVLQTDFLPPQFTIEKQYNDMSTFMMRNGKIKEHSAHRHVSARDTTFTPSHHQHTTPILDKQPCFFLNYFTKSLATGHEGGSRNHGDKHQEIPLPTTRDIHEVLELPEDVEHSIDSILYFHQSTNYIGHIARVAGLTTYDENTWKSIEPMLTSEGVRKHVSEQFRKRLSLFKNAHREAEYQCEVFLSTRPINEFLRSLRKPISYDGFTFPYYDLASEVTLFASSVFGSYNSQRYPHVNFFFRQILPLLPDANSHMLLIGPTSLVMVLFYFSKLCESLIPLLSQVPSDFESYEAAYEIASDDVNTRYPSGQPNRKFLIKTLKSIIKNGTIIDDLSYSVYKQYHIKSVYVSHIAPILGFFNSACHCLISEPRWNEMYQLISLFGIADDEAAIEARFPLYADKMRLPSQEAMHVIRCGAGSGKIFVSPLS